MLTKIKQQISKLNTTIKEKLTKYTGINEDYLEIFYSAGVNIFGLICIVYATYTGIIGHMLAVDDTGITISILLAFLVGLYLTVMRIFQANRLVAKTQYHREEELYSGIRYIKWLTGLVVMLGLLGTVVGLLITFESIGGESFSAENASVIMAGLSKGMTIAFYTTIVGVVANIWLKLNYLIMQTAISRFLKRKKEHNIVL